MTVTDTTEVALLKTALRDLAHAAHNIIGAQPFELEHQDLADAEGVEMQLSDYDEEGDITVGDLRQLSSALEVALGLVAR